MPVHVRRRLTKWGNGYGLRITVAEAKRLGVQAGQEVEADLLGPPAANDLSAFPLFHLGGGIGDLDEEIDLDLEEQHGRR